MAARKWQFLAAVAAVSGCSQPVASGNSATGEDSASARVCNWAARGDGRGGVTIGELVESLPDPEAGVGDELCRTITAIHRGRRLTVSVASFRAREIDGRIKECAARADPVLAGQIESSEGGDELEILAGLARRTQCWTMFVRQIESRFGRPAAEETELIPSERLIAALERRRRESLISHLSIYDDVATAIPLRMTATGDGSLTIRCLVRPRESTASPATTVTSPDWRDCIRRVAG